jgi:hypothetical protein
VTLDGFKLQKPMEARIYLRTFLCPPKIDFLHDFPITIFTSEKKSRKSKILFVFFAHLITAREKLLSSTFKNTKRPSKRSFDVLFFVDCFYFSDIIISLRLEDYFRSVELLKSKMDGRGSVLQLTIDHVEQGTLCDWSVSVWKLWNRWPGKIQIFHNPFGSWLWNNCCPYVAFLFSQKIDILQKKMYRLINKCRPGPNDDFHAFQLKTTRPRKATYGRHLTFKAEEREREKMFPRNPIPRKCTKSRKYDIF